MHAPADLWTPYAAEEEISSGRRRRCPTPREVLFCMWDRRWFWAKLHFQIVWWRWYLTHGNEMQMDRMMQAMGIRQRSATGYDRKHRNEMKKKWQSGGWVGRVDRWVGGCRLALALDYHCIPFLTFRRHTSPYHPASQRIANRGGSTPAGNASGSAYAAPGVL